MKKVDYMSVAEKVIDQIKRGAFLRLTEVDSSERQAASAGHEE